MTNLERSPGSGMNINLKKEYSDERLLPVPCCKCDARFPTSNKMLQHMKERHAETGDADRYQNTIATCPFCKHDCQTRKKLMQHLAMEHKDEEDEPPVKVIRISTHERNQQQIFEHLKQQQQRPRDGIVGGPFVTPGPSENNIMVQNLLHAIGNGGKGSANVKVETKVPTKNQYKCFWCDASYRKRGKLMDHIDNLHKHNKQAENKMSGSMEDTKPLGSQHSNVMGLNPAVDRMSVNMSSFLPGMRFPSISHQQVAVSTSAFTPPSAPTVSRKPKSKGTCSFTLSGSLTTRTKAPVKENEKPVVCQFFLSKKENPLANIKSNPVTNTIRAMSGMRRSSLPNLFDTSSPPYGFPYGMLPPSSMATAMQQSYLMSMRAPMMHPSPFYAPRMPLMMPGSSDYLLNSQMLEHHSQNSQQAQFFARMSAMAQTSPLARPKNPESPLDLTKSYNM